MSARGPAPAVDLPPLERLSNPHFLVEGEDSAAAACVLAARSPGAIAGVVASEDSPLARFLIGDWRRGQEIHLQLGNLRSETGYRLLLEHIVALGEGGADVATTRAAAEAVEALRAQDAATAVARKGRYRLVEVDLAPGRTRAEWSALLDESQRLFGLPPATLRGEAAALVATVPASDPRELAHLAASGAAPRVSAIDREIDLAERAEALAKRYQRPVDDALREVAGDEQRREPWLVAFAFAPSAGDALAGLDNRRVVDELRRRAPTAAIAETFASRFAGRIEVGAWWDAAPRRISLKGCDDFRSAVLIEMVREGAAAARFAGRAKALVIDASAWTRHPALLPVIDELLRGGRKDGLHAVLVQGRDDVLPDALRALVGNHLHGDRAGWRLSSTSLGPEPFALGTWYTVEEAHAARRLGLAEERA